MQPKVIRFQNGFIISRFIQILFVRSNFMFDRLYVTALFMCTQLIQYQFYGFYGKQISKIISQSFFQILFSIVLSYFCHSVFRDI